MLNVSPLRGKDLMTCDDLEPLLVVYVDGELGSPEREEVETHLSGCDDCRNEADFHKNFKRRLHQARPSTRRG